MCRLNRASKLKGFADRLLCWYADHGRHDLPWQTDRSPYRVWISEIMLQQTQVATVVPYFERFVGRFPDMQSLAAASTDEVLALWSGLGYYARARNLHRAAGIAVEQYGGVLPERIEELIALPGIGRSTAAAILALARAQRHAILDGNVKRVLARWHAIEGWPGKTDIARKLWDRAEALTPTRRVADYTQAIMDLGATVCVRGKPICDDCPVVADCAARRLGIEASLPTPRKKAERPERSVTVVVLQSASGETLLERRPPTGIWGGLLSFPEIAGDESPGDWCRHNFGVSPVAESELAVVQHGFTHFVLTLSPVRLKLSEDPRVAMDGNRWLWYKATEPLPGGVAAPIGKMLREIIGTELLH